MRVPSSAKIFAVLMACGVAEARAQCGPPEEPVPAVRESLLVSTEWLAAHLRDSNLVILEVAHMMDAGTRGREDARPRIPGARRADAMAFGMSGHAIPSAATLDSLVESLGISNRSRVILYGDPWSTGWVFAALDALGHGDRAALLDGGIDQWRAEGRPVSGQPASTTRGSYTPRPHTAGIVDAAWVRTHLTDRRVAVLDVRSREEYEGRSREESGRSGHIPGARHLEWLRTFEQPVVANDGRSSKLKAPRELRALAREAGLGMGDTPVLYCTVGMRAGHMYFIMRYLGYDPKIYVGSFADWARHADYPIVTGPSRGNP